MSKQLSAFKLSIGHIEYYKPKQSPSGRYIRFYKDCGCYHIQTFNVFSQRQSWDTADKFKDALKIFNHKKLFCKNA